MIYVWHEESVTPLGGGASFTGSSRDLFRALKDVISPPGPSKFRVGSVADVAGTLWVEQSRDGSTWHRMEEQAAVLLASKYVMGVEALPTMRYVRAGYTNGAGAQALFVLSSVELDD